MAPEKHETVMTRLRDETRDLHDAAERHELMRGLMKGTLDREQYAQHLGQLLHLHRALETALRAASAREPAIARVVESHQYQEAYLVEDLRFLGVDPQGVAAQPATLRAIATIDASEPLTLLGMHYVLEGSNNGGRFIARAVAKAYGLAPGPGLRYLDPYGEDQPALWSRFKDAMEACGFSRGQQDQLVDGARKMFAIVASIADDVLGGVAA